MEYLQNFDITNQMNILRLICGLFFVPHIYAKFFVPEALGFFIATGVKQPKVWLYAACVIETIVAFGLVFGYEFEIHKRSCQLPVVSCQSQTQRTRSPTERNFGG